MPRLDPNSLYRGGVTTRTRVRALWPRCKACGELLHPTLAQVGTHALCSELLPAVWDKLAGWHARSTP